MCNQFEQYKMDICDFFDKLNKLKVLCKNQGFPDQFAQSYILSICDPNNIDNLIEFIGSVKFVDKIDSDEMYRKFGFETEINNKYFRLYTEVPLNHDYSNVDFYLKSMFFDLHSRFLRDKKGIRR